MYQIKTYLRNYYILILLLCILSNPTSAKDIDTFKYVSFSENTVENTSFILTADQITISRDGIIVTIEDNETIINKTYGKVVLKATNKIVFVPGTKIEPGQTLHASITGTSIQEERLLEQIKYELSCLFNKTESDKDRLKDSSDNQIEAFSSTKVQGVLDNQQRRNGILNSTSHQFAAIYIKLKDNLLQTNSSFSPETVKVLRL